ncbi:MAG: hypothetical protein Q9213_002203 [Squamulea squamosa]
MLVLRTAFVSLALLTSFILAVSDYTKSENQTPELQILWKEAQKKNVALDPSKIYTFRQRDKPFWSSHTRVVVGHLFKEDENDDDKKWEFQAFWFALGLHEDTRSQMDQIYGGKCIPKSGQWECRNGNVFNFKGKVNIKEWTEVREVVGNTADAIITKNDCYNLITNNCKTFASKLTKKITVDTPAGQTSLEDPVDIGEVEFDGDDDEQYQGDDGEGDD